MHILAQHTLTAEEALKGTWAFKRRCMRPPRSLGRSWSSSECSLLAARASWGFSLIMTFNGLLLLDHARRPSSAGPSGAGAPRPTRPR
ncbi:MAG: hypothetical protein IPP58_12165 [Holophagaceae bacterium]|uniref:Uncharacterized protein n=1 Tax=Candidatus Geothrix skivensis TaxID=2954439 RepID=A0A9D7SGG5_9BACT|nr:hypothetical protein [Candidatus Geothrix skivensis]